MVKFQQLVRLDRDKNVCETMTASLNIFRGILSMVEGVKKYDRWIK